MQFPHARILVMAKAPLPGACKTRLIPALGPEGAATLAETLLCDTLERLSDEGLAPIELWCAPDISHPVFQKLAARFELQLEIQRGADLGERMQAAIAATLTHAEMAVLIGTDCPGLDAEYLQQALIALINRPAVLGPADDGGYVLLGLRREALPALTALFAPMAWGTDQVAALTRARMRAAGLHWEELPSLADIDRPEDLALGLHRLAHIPPSSNRAANDLLRVLLNSSLRWTAKDQLKHQLGAKVGEDQDAEAGEGPGDRLATAPSP